VCNDLELVKLAYWNWDLVNCKFEDFLTLGLNHVVWKMLKMYPFVKVSKLDKFQDSYNFVVRVIYILSRGSLIAEMLVYT
jgi:hypothetical protein